MSLIINYIEEAHQSAECSELHFWPGQVKAVELSKTELLLRLKAACDYSLVVQALLEKAHKSAEWSELYFWPGGINK